MVLGLGGRWVLSPSIWQKPNPITTEQIKKAFPIRLAKVPEDLLEFQAEQDDELFAHSPKLITNEWVYREVRNRFVVFFFGWIGSGFLIHWLLGRILHDRTSWLEELPALELEQ